MLKISKLAFGYTKSKLFEIEDLEISSGQHIALLGQSGSGKTTLLHIIGGLLAPERGEVSLAGQSIYALSGSKLDTFRATHIGLVFQKPHLIKALNVADNLKLTQYLAGLPQDNERIKEVLTNLGLADKLKSQINELSQGEAQRVSIARALLNRPKLILADEPTASLDDLNSAKVIDLLKSQADQYGATLIIATHDQRVKSLIPQTIEMQQLS
ncbi:ABC transporter ATP-binding protein [Penaeicola halotolerans]|uniref:ABC transporter ATP-binding protein n=1 Tax=Penaeicola halotolerans TaxID=2793196 RepID=UPI001CF91CA4|nr:ABC transporter ATP-binding protein [Penaeicola halotolerans]